MQCESAFIEPKLPLRDPGFKSLGAYPQEKDTPRPTFLILLRLMLPLNDPDM